MVPREAGWNTRQFEPNVEKDGDIENKWKTPKSRSHRENIFYSRSTKSRIRLLLLDNKFFTFCIIRKFITVFTKPCRWTLFWASQVQYTFSRHIALTSILILPYHLRLGHTSGFFLSGPRTNILYKFLMSIVRATCPNLALLNLFAVIKLLISVLKCLV